MEERLLCRIIYKIKKKTNNLKSVILKLFFLTEFHYIYTH